MLDAAQRIHGSDRLKSRRRHRVAAMVRRMAIATRWRALRFVVGSFDKYDLLGPRHQTVLGRATMRAKCRLKTTTNVLTTTTTRRATKQKWRRILGNETI